MRARFAGVRKAGRQAGRPECPPRLSPYTCCLALALLLLLAGSQVCSEVLVETFELGDHITAYISDEGNPINHK